MVDKAHIEIVFGYNAEEIFWISMPLTQTMHTLNDVLDVLPWKINMAEYRLSLWGKPVRSSQSLVSGQRLMITQLLKRTPNEIRLTRKRLGMQ